MKDTLIILKDGQANNIHITTYPDGQHNVKIKLDEFDVKKPITIHCSIKNFKELEILLCIIWAFRQHDFFIAEIHFIYLFGLRSDRAFEPGMCNYLRDVLGPIIKDLNIPSVIFFCPHNRHAINNFLGICNPHTIWMENSALTTQELPTNLQSLSHLVISSSNLLDVFIILGGDKSSEISYYDSSDEHISFSFNKIRDEEGIHVNLEEPVIEILRNIFISRPIVIVDDLCDAGGTFIEEAKYLKNLLPHKRLHLFVAHGLFTKGIDIVAEHFDMIFTTNSYQEINHPKVYQYKVI